MHPTVHLTKRTDYRRMIRPDQIPSPAVAVVCDLKFVTTISGVLDPLLPRGLYVGTTGDLTFYLFPLVPRTNDLPFGFVVESHRW